MKNIVAKARLIIISGIMATTFVGCSSPSSQPNTKETGVSDNSSYETSEQASSETSTTVPSKIVQHEYVHGTDGYYNIQEDGIEFELTPQISGTCWICAASCSLMTAYQKNHDGSIVLDQIDLLNEVYDDDKEEGIFVAQGADTRQLGGSGLFIMNELTEGFGNNLVMDSSIDAKDWSIDEIKNGIRKYGALYIGIPDSSSKKGTHDNYFTMNYPDAPQNYFDHSIAVIGWDDNFPKEYFNEEASRNGAWITYNSAYPSDYYYVSYDTPFDELYDTPLFMSMTDSYSKVLSYDCGRWYVDPVSTGKTTTTANVFHEKGTLAAVGTYAVTDDQDLTIQILTPDLKECLYSQEYHADRKGYYVFKLDTPMEVEDYAIAVTYPAGAPVEGESVEIDHTVHIDITGKSGQSFILVDGKWLDMSEEKTQNILGSVTNNACIKALYSK